jgi:hypothetical protein
MSTPNGTVTLKNLGSQSTIVDVKNCVAMKWSNTNFSIGYDISGQIQLICHEINWDEWYLSFHGKPLRDHLSLADLNINNESTIQLMGRMHGAGKKARIPLRDLTNIRTPSSTTSVPTELKDQCQLLTSTPDPTGESKVQCELPLVSTPESKDPRCAFCGKSSYRKRGCFHGSAPIRLSEEAVALARKMAAQGVGMFVESNFIGKNCARSFKRYLNKRSETPLQLDIDMFRTPVNTETDHEVPTPTTTNFTHTTMKRNRNFDVKLEEAIPLDQKNTRLMYCSLNDWIEAKLAAPCNFHSRYEENCTGKLRMIKEPDIQGHNVVLHVQCEDDPRHIHDIANYTQDKVMGILKTNSQDETKQSSGSYPINALSVLAHTMAGTDHTAAFVYESIMMGHAMESQMFHNIQGHIWDAVRLEFGKSKERVHQAIMESKEWTLVADTGWGTKGWTAQHGSLPLIWYEQQLIVLHEVMSKDQERNGDVLVPGNYAGTPKCLFVCLCVYLIFHIDR